MKDEKIMFGIFGIFWIFFIIQSASALTYSMNVLSSGVTGGIVMDISQDPADNNTFFFVGNSSSGGLGNFIKGVTYPTTPICFNSNTKSGAYVVTPSDLIGGGSIEYDNFLFMSGTTVAGNFSIQKILRTDCSVVMEANQWTTTVWSKRFNIVQDSGGYIWEMFFSADDNIKYRMIDVNGSVINNSILTIPLAPSDYYQYAFDMIYNPNNNEIISLYPENSGGIGRYFIVSIDQNQTLKWVNNIDLATTGIPLTKSGNIQIDTSGYVYWITNDESSNIKIYRTDRYGGAVASTNTSYKYLSYDTLGGSSVYDSLTNKLYVIGQYKYTIPSGYRWIPIMLEYDLNSFTLTNVYRDTRFYDNMTFNPDIRGWIDTDSKTIFTAGQSDDGITTIPVVVAWVLSATPPTCGDSICLGAYEDCNTCPTDCTCTYGNYFEYFDNLNNWENTTSFGLTGRGFEISPLNTLHLLAPTGNYVHTLNSSFFIKTPMIYSFNVFLNETASDISYSYLYDSDGSSGMLFTFNSVGDAIGYTGIGTCNFTSSGSTSYTFTGENTYNVTIYLGSSLSYIYVDGNEAITFPTISSCMPMTYIFLGGQSSVNDLRYSNVFLFQGGYSPPVQISNETIMVDVTVFKSSYIFDPYTFDEQGCPINVPQANLYLFNGATGEFLQKKLANEMLMNANCCIQDGVPVPNHTCYGSRFIINSSVSNITLIANMSGYQSMIYNKLISVTHTGVNLALFPKDIIRLDVDILNDYNSEPIQNVVGCLFYTNNTLARPCISTSNIGKLYFLIANNTPHYLFLSTPAGVQCVQSTNFTYTKNTGDIYTLPQVLADWSVTLSADRLTTSQNESVNFKIAVCRDSSIPFDFELWYKINQSSFLYANTTIGYYQYNQNPLFFTENMSYCGNDINVWANVIDGNGNSMESNHLTISVLPPCVNPQSVFGVNSTPMASISAGLPDALSCVDYFFSPIVFIILITFGISGALASKMGEKNKGVIFVVGVMTLLGILAIQGSFPLWMVGLFIILLLGAGLFYMRKGGD
jgi:hypothetical protein